MLLSTPSHLTVGLTRKGVYSASFQLCLSSQAACRARPATQYRRYASTSQASRQPDAPNSSSKSQKSKDFPIPTSQPQSPDTTGEDRINPPISTIPAPVDPPSRRPDQSKIGWLYNVGKAYVAFYKTGVKNVWANRKLEKQLSARLSKFKQERQSDQALQPQEYPLSRAEHQTVQRSRYDWRRVPVFALILLVFGEWTPLIVVFATPLVPYTCRIPRQIEAARRKQEERRKQSFRGELQEPITVLGQAPNKQKEHAERLQHVCRSLGLYPALFDNQVTRSFWPPVSMMKRRVEARLQSIELDDELLLRDATRSRSSSVDEAAGIVARRLASEEVQLACEFRGVDILGRPETELRKALAMWLKTCARKSDNEADLENKITFKVLQARPNVWK